MALRNYMYFKHEDNLKDRIAHGIGIYTPEQLPQHQGSQGLIPRDVQTSDNASSSHRMMLKKPKKLTPTQLRKLQKMQIQDDVERTSNTGVDRGVGVDVGGGVTVSVKVSSNGCGGDMRPCVNNGVNAGHAGHGGHGGYSGHGGYDGEYQYLKPGSIQSRKENGNRTRGSGSSSNNFGSGFGSSSGSGSGSSSFNKTHVRDRTG